MVCFYRACVFCKQLWYLITAGVRKGYGLGKHVRVYCLRIRICIKHCVCRVFRASSVRKANLLFCNPRKRVARSCRRRGACCVPDTAHVGNVIYPRYDTFPHVQRRCLHVNSAGQQIHFRGEAVKTAAHQPCVRYDSNCAYQYLILLV